VVISAGGASCAKTAAARATVRTKRKTRMVVWFGLKEERGRCLCACGSRGREEGAGVSACGELRERCVCGAASPSKNGCACGAQPLSRRGADKGQGMKKEGRLPYAWGSLDRPARLDSTYGGTPGKIVWSAGERASGSMSCLCPTNPGGVQRQDIPQKQHVSTEARDKGRE